jgi:hypothetical protein
MTKEQFEQLRRILLIAREEAANDETLGDWLINLGGSLISMGVDLTSQEDDE